MDAGARLNLTHLATLVEFGRRGTLGAAADALGYTPGAVSQHLAALERQVGVPLVRKAGRTRVLTDAGHVLREHADRVLRSEREAMRAATAVGREVTGPLTVGTWGSTAAALLVPLVHRFAREHPAVDVGSREVDLDAAPGDVLHGRVDVAFGIEYAAAPLPRHPGISLVLLAREEFALGTAAGRPGPETLEAEELQEYPWILPPAGSQYGTATRAALRHRGIEPRVVHEVTDTAATLHLTAAGLGLSLVTPMMQRLTADLPLLLRPMPDPMTRDVVLLVPRAETQRHVAAFVRTAAVVAAELTPAAAPGRR